MNDTGIPISEILTALMKGERITSNDAVFVKCFPKDVWLTFVMLMFIIEPWEGCEKQEASRSKVIILD